ncbi:MAG TPA: NAD(P)/FAD-dependent oxidoreductase [Gaiella sp.]|nr:NAD(P)/FAD-dependent oxidoreductase [Gaiella sp.]
MSATAERTGRPVVLVLGAGFGGIGAARALKDADVEVVLVDKHDYHTFQPLLYQLATDLLEPSAVGHAVRDLFHDQPNVSVHQAAATGIDLERREVELDRMAPVRYDYLVLALGAEVEFFGTDGADEHAFPMYTLADAVRLKEHVLQKWEDADRDPSLVADGALNVVVVGGGPTGVETVGALAELYRTNFAQDFPSLPQEEARLILVEAGDDLFTMFKPEIRRYAKEVLEKKDVEVVLGDLVTAVTPTRVTLKSGRAIEAHTLVWGAGLAAHPLGAALGVELQRGHRVPVEGELHLAGHPEVFVVGDIGWITDTGTDEVLPQLGSVALQAGEHAGENIARLVEGKGTEPFVYTDKGTMAMIGRGAGVVQFKHGRTLKGRTAFLAWGAVHLALLSTGEDRAKAVVDWTWSGMSHERPGRITVRADD